MQGAGVERGPEHTGRKQKEKSRPSKARVTASQVGLFLSLCRTQQELKTVNTLTRSSPFWALIPGYNLKEEEKAICTKIFIAALFIMTKNLKTTLISTNGRRVN